MVHYSTSIAWALGSCPIKIKGVKIYVFNFYPQKKQVLSKLHKHKCLTATILSRLRHDFMSEINLFHVWIFN